MPDKELNKMTDNGLRAFRFLNIEFYSSSVFKFCRDLQDVLRRLSITRHTILMPHKVTISGLSFCGLGRDICFLS